MDNPYVALLCAGTSALISLKIRSHSTHKLTLDRPLGLICRGSAWGTLSYSLPRAGFFQELSRRGHSGCCAPAVFCAAPIGGVPIGGQPLSLRLTPLPNACCRAQIAVPNKTVGQRYHGDEHCPFFKRGGRFACGVLSLPPAWPGLTSCRARLGLPAVESVRTSAAQGWQARRAERIASPGA